MILEILCVVFFVLWALTNFGNYPAGSGYYYGNKGLMIAWAGILIYCVFNGIHH